jgi:N-acetylglutamate synthase-like GNAT family acetyltransferase
VTGAVYRQAALGDAAEIHALVLALAPEVPLVIATLEREEMIYALIRQCARSGESWVASDGDGRIIGFALAERADRGRHYAEHEVLELRYAAAAAEWRAAGVVERLIERLLERMVPIVMTVSPHNRTGVAHSLERLGFRASAAPGGEQLYRWAPGAAR